MKKLTIFETVNRSGKPTNTRKRDIFWKAGFVGESGKNGPVATANELNMANGGLK